MSRFSFSSTGSTNNTEDWLRRMSTGTIFERLDPYAKAGVAALASATPRGTGKTAASWSYKIESSGGSTTIVWLNSNVHNGFPVAVMLQYGHGTGTGGYVSGRDYINPAIKPVMDEILDNVVKELNR